MVVEDDEGRAYPGEKHPVQPPDQSTILFLLDKGLWKPHFPHPYTAYDNVVILKVY